MAITLVPIHESGGHQRSLQVATINDAYEEIRKHAKWRLSTLFTKASYDPIVKFAIINGDKAEVVDVATFKKFKKV